MMQDESNRSTSVHVSTRVIVLVTIAALLGGLAGYGLGSISGSSDAWNQVRKLGSSAAQAAPDTGGYPREVVADCRDGLSRDPSIDCEAVLAAQPEPKSNYDMAIAAVRTIDTGCPSPTTREAGTGNCVLTDDVVLADALWLSSGTTLDCKGHRMTPSVDGEAGVPWEPPYPKPSVPSVPNTAVLLAGDTSGVTVKNCVIENFDFGIVIANSKVPPAAKTASRNLITGNTLNNRYRGVQIIASDRNEIVDNQIHSFSKSSGGVGIFHDSDDNLIKGNTYVGPNPEWWTPGPSFPGGADEVGTAMQWDGEGVRLIGPTVSYNFKVGSRTFVGTRSPSGWAERNRIEENDITTQSRGIDTDSLTDGTMIRRNILRDVGEGIGMLSHFRGQGFISKNVIVEENTVMKALEAGILVAFTDNPVVRANKFTNSWAGIFMGGDSFGSATITKNLVQDTDVGIFLFQCCGRAAAEYRAKVFHNDFVVRDEGIGVIAEVGSPADLSFEGKGNYWGHTEAPAFRATDASDPSLVTDSYASLVPLSGLLDD